MSHDKPVGLDYQERCVINKCNVGSINAFLLIFLQFQLKDVLAQALVMRFHHVFTYVVEEVLKLFIRQVDAHLFETVDSKVLKSINIEDTC